MVVTHRERYLKRVGLDPSKSYSIPELSKVSGVPVKILEAVYSRGMGAAKSNLASVRLKSDFSKNPDTTAFPKSARLSPQQWAQARVYSFLDKGTTFYTADADLARKL